MALALASLGLRGFQALFAIVIFGLSVSLIKTNYGHAPAMHGYAAFLGSVSLIAAIAGIAANWLESLNDLVLMIIDATILVANIAGGVIIAFMIRGIKCSKNQGSQNAALNLVYNKLIYDNCDKNTACQSNDTDAWLGKILWRCRSNQASSAFMFLLALALAASVAIAYLHRKNR
ncbi:marvel domain-containing protein [Lophiotrema nucula]|uniref:Marvel domain-containing protein n=1 Tax=Lophiotrema nucula TaxID=690887 RepID=A0A6A5YS96_9PLEO|nr:marvel domain-containing protein [Lophiotrema nucula]